MTLCRLTGVEPYITVNSGFGDARSAAEYVEYANGPATTPWGAKRAANGHPEPYGVKLWNIGNEMWGSYQYGYMPLAQYAVKHNLFAKAMRKVDPGIVLIASGAMPDTMTGSKESLKLGDKLVPEYLGPADWTGDALPEVPRRHGHDQRALLQLRLPLRPREREAGAQCPERAARRLDATPGQPHPPEVRGVPGVRLAHPRAEAEARAHRARRVRLHLRRQLQGGPRLRVELPRDVPPLRPVPAGHADLHHLHLQCRARAGRAQPDGHALQALPGPLRHRSGRGVGQLAAAQTHGSSGRRAARRPRRQRHLPAGRGRGLDRRPQGAHRRRHQPDRGSADPEPRHPRRRPLRDGHPAPHGPAEPHRQRRRRPGAGRAGSTSSR